MIENEFQINDIVQVQDVDLINGNEEFIGDMKREELGLFYLFQASGLDNDDSFFFEELSDDAAAIEQPRKMKKEMHIKKI